MLRAGEEVPPRTHYHYDVSLRVRHPSADPKELTQQFGIQPRRSWKCGEPRKTPKGLALPGFYHETYWTVSVAQGQWPSDLNEAIHEALKKLVPCRAFLHRIRAEGAEVEFFIGWFFHNQSGEVFNFQCLALAGDLQIDFSFDVYPYDQDEDDPRH